MHRRHGGERLPAPDFGDGGAPDNFGVVTGFKFRLHPIPPTLTFCAPAYPESRASKLIRVWRDFMTKAPARLSSYAEFSTIPRDPGYSGARHRLGIDVAPHILPQQTGI